MAVLTASLVADQFVSGGGQMVSTTAAIVSSLTEANNSLKRMENTLLTSSGSVKAAKEDLVRLRDVTDRLGISLEASATPFAKFAASAKDLSKEETFKVFEGFATALSATHASAEKVQGTFLALQQIMSKGKVNMQDLRRQLAEHIPGAMEQARAAFGDGTASMEQFETAVTNGMVNSSEWVVKFAALMENKFGPAAIRAAGTLQAEMERMGTSWLLFKANILETSGATESFKDVLVTLRTDITGNKVIIDNLGASVGAFAEAAASATRSAAPLAEKASYVSLAVGKLAENSSKLLEIATKLNPVTLGNAAANGTWNKKLEESSFLIKDILGGMSELEYQKAFASMTNDTAEALVAIRVFESERTALYESGFRLQKEGVAALAAFEKSQAKEIAEAKQTIMQDMYDKAGVASKEFLEMERTKLEESVSAWTDKAAQVRYVDEEIAKIVAGTHAAKEAAKALAEEEKLVKEEAKLAADEAKRIEAETKKAESAAKKLSDEFKRTATAAKAAAEAAAKIQSKEDAIANETRIEGESDKDFAARIGVDEKLIKGSSYSSSKAWSGGTSSMGSALDMTQAEQDYYNSVVTQGSGDHYWDSDYSASKSGLYGGDHVNDNLDTLLMQQENALSTIYAARDSNGGEPVTSITNIFNQSISSSDVTNIIEEMQRQVART